MSGLRLRAALAVVVVAVAAAIAPLPPDLVERSYGRGFYPPLQRALTSFSNLFPFALFDVLLVALMVWAVARVVSRMRRAQGSRWRGIGRAAGDLAVASAAIYLAFLVLWGFNYRRELLTSRLDFGRDRVSREGLVELARTTVGELNRLYDAAWQRRWLQFDELPAAMHGAFARAQQELSGAPDSVAPGSGDRWARPGRPKWSALSWYFQRSAIDGMTDPFFLEVLLNQALWPFERPFVVAHEWAHLAGHAQESEANFVAWLICLRGDEQAQYSGWLVLYLHVARELPASGRDVLSPLGEGPRRDASDIVARYRRASPVVREAAGKVYDRFLKANRVESGVASYNEVVALILGTRFAPGWVPVVRAPR